MITLRQSSLQTFIECKRKFYLEVVLNLQHEREALLPRKHRTADTGTLIHEVLRLYYNGELPDDADRNMVYDIVFAKAQEIGGLTEEAEPEYLATVLSDWYKACEVATVVSLNYMPWVEASGHDLRYTVLDIETRMEYQVPGTSIVVTGQPDLVLYDDLIHETGVLDHKSVATLDAPRPGNFQLLTYGWLYWMTTGTVPQWAGHNQLKRNLQTAKAKPPFYDRKPVHLDEEMLRQHGEMVHALCEDIENFYARITEENHHRMAYPNMNGECSWKCGVQELCDRFHDGNEVWTEMAETYYIQRTGDNHS